SQELFINRDLSLIEFNRRVLEEAQDQRLPLLERLKFISILSSLLDEFFMIRVSGHKEHLDEDGPSFPDALPPSKLLKEIRQRVCDLTAVQTGCLKNDILPALEKEGISLVQFDSLPYHDREAMTKYFCEQIYPVLTPQAVDPSHPFPYISGGSLNLGVIVRPNLYKRVRKAHRLSGDELFIRLKIPAFIDRLIPVGKQGRYLLAEDLIASHIKTLIPEADSKDCHAFRITRDADIELREEEAHDLLQEMEDNLKQRRFGEVVRLEVSESMPSKMRKYLRRSLEIRSRDIYRIDGPLNLTDFNELYKINRPDLKDQPLKITRPPEFDAAVSTFDIIKKGDVMLHHPYMPYSIITDFIAEAAEDPDVLAIKICLYRMGPESPIPPLLIKASENGKAVTVLIEIKARFDEENNIEWAKKLERAGVHVIYGMLGLKTHAKTTLIVRREKNKLRRYVHLATGNYNPQTSAIYTDIGLLTVDEEIGQDATELFNFLTAYSPPGEFRKLLVAPANLRQNMTDLINREAENARAGKPARIIAKNNRIADAEIVSALYDASQAGVEVDLIVRGICTLRPGIPGFSENIRVRSIVGRLLEHSRVYYFENGGDPELYIGSSDWMPRNLDRRVEVLTPIMTPKLKEFLKDRYLSAYLRDTAKARELAPDDSYRRVQPAPGEEEFNCQLAFQEGTNVVDFLTRHP
ncbi:MAG TPA: polyphosphate kinase 1, partial [Pyrinomonadaceae bacterium]|nr:polyphosphate kinase 1 [Pyrinomonadaceae bacterium]